MYDCGAFSPVFGIRFAVPYFKEKKMKKSYLIAIIALFAVLCLCLAGCDLFGKPGNPDNPDAVYDLSKLQVGLDNAS